MGLEFEKLESKFVEDEASMPGTLLHFYLVNLRGHQDGRQTRRCWGKWKCSNKRVKLKIWNIFKENSVKNVANIIASFDSKKFPYL